MPWVDGHYSRRAGRHRERQCRQDDLSLLRRRLRGTKRAEIRRGVWNT